MAKQILSPAPVPSPREMSPADVAAHQAASYVRPARIDATLSPAALQLRTHARAAGYNPDRPSAVAALACVAGVETSHLTAVFAGHADIDRLTRIRVLRTLGLSTAVSIGGR